MLRTLAPRHAARTPGVCGAPRRRSASPLWALFYAFWIDPKEELTVVFMTQVIGSEARLTLRRDLRTLVYSAMTESFA